MVGIWLGYGWMMDSKILRMGCWAYIEALLQLRLLTDLCSCEKWKGVIATLEPHNRPQNFISYRHYSQLKLSDKSGWQNGAAQLVQATAEI